MGNFPWGGERHYNSYASYFKDRYGARMQKLSVDAGFTCPNRGSNRNFGGCTFCNNEAFNPSYCSPSKPIAQQIDEGIAFHEHRYRNASDYLAYFQAYSNTYAPVEVLRSKYNEALSHPSVKGLVIATRPDCVDEKKLDMIAELSKTKYVAIEYGIESCYDTTLKAVHRGHDFSATRRALEQTAARGIHCGGHLILGLPGENRAMMMHEAAMINETPLEMIKLHQLQILKGSAMERQMKSAAARNEKDDTWGLHRGFELGEYVELVCDFLERLRPDIMIGRLAGEVPPRHQACPQRSWRRADGRLLRNEEIPQLVEKEFQRRNSCQGSALVLQNNNNRTL